MKNRKRIKICLLLTMLAMCFLGCGHEADETKAWIESKEGKATSYDLEYAKLFSIDKCEDRNYIIEVNNQDYYLLVPEGGTVPDQVPKGITVLEQPIESIYVVGTGSMDFFVKANALDQVKYSSLEARDWQLEEVSDAISSGDITYAGKYSAPDYELLLSKGCDLIVENTMITHSPEVLSQLKDLGFNSIVDYASYEDTVEGRMEWIKLYGLLTGQEEVANEAFEAQKQLLLSCRETGKEQTTRKKVGFFSITAAGTVSIRKNDDYINDMIEIAGGENGLQMERIDGTGSTTVQMESFYEKAKDCDILIYNGTIEGEISSIEALTVKNQLLASLQAVKSGQVYCTRGSFYQSVMELGEITKDINNILLENEELTFLYKMD